MKGSHCPLGAYRVVSDTSDMAAACAPCPRGKYCRAGVIAGPCSAGFLCGLGNSVPNPDYSKFPRSPYIPTEVQESGGGVVLTELNWDTVLDTAYGGIPCPSGYYCSEGAEQPSDCNRGSFRLQKGGRWPSDCSLCPVGGEMHEPCIASAVRGTDPLGSILEPSRACEDVSDEDSAEPCAPKEYPVCKESRVYTHTGMCQETSQVCEDYCGKRGGKYKPENTLCECSGLPSIEDVCDEECRERQKSISVESGNLVVASQGGSIHSTFSLADLNGRSDVLFGSLTCSASRCPAVLYSVAPDGSTHGYFGVPDDLLAVISERLNSGESDTRAAISGSPRQLQAMLRETAAQVPSIEGPILCILAGSSVLWALEPGTEPVYPVHVRDSLYNTDMAFDSGEFRNLKTEMESGAPLLLFGHTFTNPGIVVFATSRNLNRIVFIKVVAEEAQCGSMEPGLPHPATNEFMEALSLEFPEGVRFGSPDWSTLFITFGILLLVALCLLLLQYQLRTHYWTFAPPLQVEHGNDAKDEPYVQFSRIFGGTAAHESEATNTFTDLDPRVFQAVYCKLLETMSTLKEQLEHMGLQQDQLIELELDMAGPLRTSLFPILAEASEKKAWVEVEDAELSEKLLDMNSLMHLRKGAFEEAVRKAYEAMADAEGQRLEQQNVSKMYASLESQAIEEAVRQASAELIQLAGLNPESFAAALGVEETLATTQALRHLQAMEAATHVLKEMTTKLDGQDPKAAEELLTACGSLIKEKLEATTISEHMEICEMRRSINESIGELIDQRNSAFTQKQCFRDATLLRNLAGFSKAVAALQEDIYSHFCSARRRYEKAQSTKRLTILPTIQKQFMEAAENVYKNIANIEQLSWSKREAMETEMLKAYHSALSQTRQGQLAFRHELERSLVAEKTRNECLIRLYVADESGEDISEECRVATEQQLDAISFEQRNALADLKVAMDSEHTRAVRLNRERLRISRALAQEDQKLATLRHDLKFRTITDELTCLLNAQTKLDESRHQSVKHFHKRIMLELEDYIRKLKVILEIPDSFTVAVELQQCLDALNKNIRGVYQTAAHSLTSVHENVTRTMVQELRSVRTGLLRAEELEEAEIGRRVEALKEQERQILEEDEERRRSFSSTVPLEDLEIETEIQETQDMLAVERIRLQFIEDERDALISQISEAKADALSQGNATELPEIIDSLKKQSLARVEEMNQRILQQSEWREADQLKSQEKRKELILKRISLANDAREKRTLWLERQFNAARDVSKRQYLEMHRFLCQITDKLFSALIGTMEKGESDHSVAGEMTVVTDSIFHEDAYASMLLTISPLMAPPSVPQQERQDLLKGSFIQWEEAVQATSQGRAKHLKACLQQACSRRRRLDSADELLRNKLLRAREAEWTTIVLDKGAADNSFALSTMGQSGVWARNYCTSVQESIKKQTEELKNKQAAELAAFEDELKVVLVFANIQAFDGKAIFAASVVKQFAQPGLEEIKEKIRKLLKLFAEKLKLLRKKSQHAAAHLEAKAADVRRREFVEGQKKELLLHELKEQREFMEAQWKLSRIAKFEELRSMQLDPSSSAAAQKELLAGCQEAELRDLKELQSRQRILILNQFFHQTQREAKDKFSQTKGLLGDLSSTPEHALDKQGNEDSVTADMAASQDVNVMAREEEEMKELKERHYTELAELVKNNENATKESAAPPKTVQVVLPDEHASGGETTSHGKAHSPDQPRNTIDNAASRLVAEWQKRIRSGSCASILIAKGDGADAKAAAIGKHLEQFVNAVIRVQREERDRQRKIMEEKLARRNERRLAKGKHRRRSTTTKKSKSSGPRKSVMDFKAERLQTTRQKEEQIKEQFKAKRDALEGWHPIFWCIVEEEAKHGSYEAYADSARIVARGPTLCNIERVINSLEEGSFLRSMIASLGILGKAFNTLGTMPDSLATESEGSESDSSSPSSNSDHMAVPGQRRKVSTASSRESQSSDSSDSSDESSSYSSSDGSSSEGSSKKSSSNGDSDAGEGRSHSQTHAGKQSATSTQNIPHDDKSVREASSASSTGSMDSKGAQETHPERGGSGTASSEKSGSSSSDGSDGSDDGSSESSNSSSSSSAITSGTSSRSESESVDETSGDSNSDSSSESSSSRSNRSSSTEKSHTDTDESQTTSRSGNESDSSRVKGSGISQPPRPEARGAAGSSSSSGSSSTSDLESPEPVRSSSAQQNSRPSRENVNNNSRPSQEDGSSQNGNTSDSSGSSSTSRQSSTAGTETSSD
ncbi:hypothetical protein, conserved [Eimeria brunetti]|uniref:GCC2 and GCC3 domain-containing protein n=1 Tax=Eimeria brunetti TaxID=51314 RepID=U6LL18_9EIME|nr:hypothetical protein, conserved [Eimeria brunetti]